MPVSLATIETLTRYLLDDNSTSMVPGDIFTYTNSAVFSLCEPNVISVTAVYQNGSALTTNDYSYDSSTNKLTVTASLTSGDTIEIQYTYYPNYSSSEIQKAVRGAVIHLSLNNYFTYEVDANDNIYPEPVSKEKNLLAMVAAILLEPNNKSYRLPDISITMPEGALPTNDMIRKTIAVFKHNTHGNFSLTGL